MRYRHSSGELTLRTSSWRTTQWGSQALRIGSEEQDSLKIRPYEQVNTGMRREWASGRAVAALLRVPAQDPRGQGL
jgi:hypothetical protein